MPLDLDKVNAQILEAIREDLEARAALTAEAEVLNAAQP